MALTEDTGTTMLVSPTGFGGNGFGGDGSWWVILLILILFSGGNWGGNGGFNAPYVDVQSGFNQAALTSGLGDIQSAITAGFAGIEASNNARQIANMQQMFDIQTQFSNCCCENRLANCQTQNVIQSEGSATRFADANNTRDILENCNRNNQAILDKLCQLELDAKQDKINDLERQLSMATLAASQTAQTSRLLADNWNQTQILENFLNPTPIPAYIVPDPNARG